MALIKIKPGTILKHRKVSNAHKLIITGYDCSAFYKVKNLETKLTFTMHHRSIIGNYQQIPLTKLASIYYGFKYENL